MPLGDFCASRGVGGVVMQISIIVAAAENNVIGADNQLPWHLSEDLKYFKKTTMGKMILMGRKTFESIGRPLPGRTNLVLTRDPAWQADGIKTVHSLDEACRYAEESCQGDECAELFVIGGEQIYRAVLAQAGKIYLTRIKAEVPGDAFFPEISGQDWELVSATPGVEQADYQYEFQVFERKTGVAPDGRYSGA